MSFPNHPFWDYSLSLYSRPGVSAACLSLQDNYGLDVNLLLFCVWAAAEGPGELSAADINTCIAATRNWQERVVQPLRNVRRYSKTAEQPVDDSTRDVFRASVQNAELDAEHVEQLILGKLAGSGELGGNAAGEPHQVAGQNLAQYLATLQVERSPAVAAHLDAILAAAF